MFKVFIKSTLFTLLVVSSISFAKAPEIESNDVNNPNKVIDNTSYIDANLIFMFVTNHGNFGRDLSGVFGYDYGTWFPYSGDMSDIIYNINNAAEKSPLYSAGIWLGGVVNGQTRVTVSEYSSEYVPGPMLNGTNQNDNFEFRVYKLYADSMASNPNYDYSNWPINQGAPVNAYGIPDLFGDQMLWSVFNDANPAQHDNNNGDTPPLGIEIQMTAWAYNSDALDTLPPSTHLNVIQHGCSKIMVTSKIINESQLTGDYYQVLYEVDPEKGPVWHLYNVSKNIYLLSDQTDFNNGTSHGVTDGFQISVKMTLDEDNWSYESSEPTNLSQVTLDDHPNYQGGIWYQGGNYGEGIFDGGVYKEPDFWGLTSTPKHKIPKVEIRWRPMASYTDQNGDGQYTIGEPYVVDDQSQTQNAFMYSTFDGTAYLGYYMVPFTAWDVTDPYNPRQVNVVVRDRDQNGFWQTHVNHADADPPINLNGLANNGDFRFNYCWILTSDYDPSGTMYGDGYSGTIDFWSYQDYNGIYDAAWVMWLNLKEGDYGMLAEEGIFTLIPSEIDPTPDTFSFIAETPYSQLVGRDQNSIYIKYKFYNKGTNIIDDMYISFWTDPDIGAPGDDLVGCDTINDIFFAYNAQPYDNNYQSPVPALGFRVLHGPVAVSPSDTAIFDNKLLPGYKNIKMASFNRYINGTDPDNASESYNYMRGLTKYGGDYSYNGQILKFVHSGNPVTGNGDLDNSPADRRMMASWGPFNFNPGDSQYVLLKMSVAQGYSHLNSITKVKSILNQPIPFRPEVEKLTIFSPNPIFEVNLNDTNDDFSPQVFTNEIDNQQTVYDVNFESLRINENIIPLNSKIIFSHPQISSPLLNIVLPPYEFLQFYFPSGSKFKSEYTITGEYNDGTPLSITGYFYFHARPGDLNKDGQLDIEDIVALVDYHFNDSQPPEPFELLDYNEDESYDIADIVKMVEFMFYIK